MPGDYPPDTINKPKDTKPNMKVFRADIQKLIDERKEQKINKTQTDLSMLDLLGVDVDELTEADAVMWKNSEKYIKGLITQKELDFRGPYLNDTLDSGLSSRTNFYAAIANKINSKWMTEEMEEIEEEEKLKEQH
ncbi:MAG: hypothetical protein WC793_02800 [Candidatus Paceibacterota bacterium]|jgi:hypothetical protein